MQVTKGRTKWGKYTQISTNKINRTYKRIKKRHLKWHGWRSCIVIGWTQCEREEIELSEEGSKKINKKKLFLFQTCFKNIFASSFFTLVSPLGFCCARLQLELSLWFLVFIRRCSDFTFFFFKSLASFATSAEKPLHQCIYSQPSTAL